MADKPKWFFLETPNPNKFGISIPVPMSSAVAFGKDSGANWPQEGDALKDNVLVAAAGIRIPELFGNFQYVTFKIGTTSEREPAVIFNYGPYLTEEEKQTPYRSYSEVKNHRWAPILLALGIQQDYTFPNSTNVIQGDPAAVGIVTAPRNYIKQIYIPDANEGTRFLIEEFFSPTKYDISQTPVPVATSIHIELLDREINIPECLHPRISQPDTRTGDVQVIAGVASGAGGGLNGQNFPATNFEVWAPYILTDQQEFGETGWHRIRVRVFPPALPDEITSQS